MYDDKDTYFLLDSQFLLMRNVVKSQILFMKKIISFHEENYFFS